ncbi:MAG TPA: hypothetical protein PK830_05040 [Candidatus Atribacteria bacterium]|nr:hypothetical protein [Candidatus Atribacteria bacterium]HPT78449.1 hypothetical protein [Candidatus Atribacteria bacterium]
MKKIILIVLAFLLAAGIVACKTGDTNADPSENPGDSVLEGDLEDILAEIYDKAELKDTSKEFIETGLQTVEITTENCDYHLGLKSMENIEKAIASQPMLSTSAYVLCLVRTKEGADIEKLKTDIKENVNPYKWVCVGVQEENIIVDNIGNVVILIMSDYDAQALHEAFLSLK